MNFSLLLFKIVINKTYKSLFFTRLKKSLCCIFTYFTHIHLKISILLVCRGSTRKKIVIVLWTNTDFERMHPMVVTTACFSCARQQSKQQPQYTYRWTFFKTTLLGSWDKTNFFEYVNSVNFISTIKRMW